MTAPEEGPGKFVAMDVALLARQSEQLDKLNESIQQLAKAIDERPTKFEVNHQRKRTRNRTVAVGMVFALLIAGLYVQNQKITKSCHDRNGNADRFRTLLLIILEPAPGQPEPTDAHSKRINKALHDYTDSLEPINC